VFSLVPDEHTVELLSAIVAHPRTNLDWDGYLEHLRPSSKWNLTWEVPILEIVVRRGGRFVSYYIEYFPMDTLGQITRLDWLQAFVKYIRLGLDGGCNLPEATAKKYLAALENYPIAEDLRKLYVEKGINVIS